MPTTGGIKSTTTHPISGGSYQNGRIACVLDPAQTNGYQTKWCAWPYQSPEPPDANKVWRTYVYGTAAQNPGWFAPGSYWVKFKATGATAPPTRSYTVSPGVETRVTFRYLVTVLAASAMSWSEASAVYVGDKITPIDAGAEIVGALTPSQSNAHQTEWCVWPLGSQEPGDEVTDKWRPISTKNAPTAPKVVPPGLYHVKFRPGDGIAPCVTPAIEVSDGFRTSVLVAFSHVLSSEYDESEDVPLTHPDAE